MKRAWSVLLVYFLSFSIPFGCSDRYPSSEIQIKSISVKIGTLAKSGYYLNFSESVQASDTISSDEFTIEIGIDDFAIAAANAISPGRFFGYAYADPVPPYSKAKITILSITSSRKVFAQGEEFEIGTNLAGLFSAQTLYGPEQGVLSFIKEQNYWSIEEPIYLKLTATLDQPLSQTLKISITMDDGAEFEAETASVIVK